MSTSSAFDLRTVDLRGQRLSDAQLNELIPRASVDIDQAISQILPLLADVKTRGVAAVVDVTISRDGVDPRPIQVSKEEMDAALEALSPALRRAIETSIERVRKVSQANMPTNTRVLLADGAAVSQRWQPVDSVGLYVPGGKAVYPSSVIMNVVPAQVAGVPRIALCSPVQADFGGRPHPSVLATAALLGVTEVYAMGGPAAVAAFAYGLAEISLEPVRMVTGPGNIYVAAAKRALRGVIGIDSEAGTTEILIIADDSANPRFVAADLISQAEHDEAAACVLVTDSIELASAVQRELSNLVSKTSNTQRVAAAIEGQQSAIVLVDDLEQAAFVANSYATEHLELQTRKNSEITSLISNAGAIFLGDHSPVSLGDYMAGSSHVLPTGQQAKFGPGLGVHSFLRPQQIVDYDAAALSAIADQVDEFARAEGLPAHGEAVKIRFEN